MATPMFMDLERLRHRWGWFLALGILMIVAGTVAFFTMPVATLAAVLVLGWVMAFSGAVELVQAFRVRKHGGSLFLHIVGGILGLGVGLLVVTHPVAGALAWTLLFASFFTVIGLFRIIASASLKFPGWGWALFDGIVTLALGILIWAQWPWSGLWFLGLALGVSLVLRGWTYTMLAIGLRTMLREPLPDIRQRAA
ncbi:MAG TPA: HdeD family acid-resistance protein [Terriglobales bacterium]|nr:HdeD family acid-resistance protein [Terriglobales bacterium]